MHVNAIFLEGNTMGAILTPTYKVLWPRISRQGFLGRDSGIDEAVLIWQPLQRLEKAFLANLWEVLQSHRAWCSVASSSQLKRLRVDTEEVQVESCLQRAPLGEDPVCRQFSSCMLLLRLTVKHPGLAWHPCLGFLRNA